MHVKICTKAFRRCNFDIVFEYSVLEHAFSLQAHPLGRVGTADDVAAMIVHLADSVKSGWVTGQTFVLDGGRLLALHGLRS